LTPEAALELDAAASGVATRLAGADDDQGTPTEGEDTALCLKGGFPCLAGVGGRADATAAPLAEHPFRLTPGPPLFTLEPPLTTPELPLFTPEPPLFTPESPIITPESRLFTAESAAPFTPGLGASSALSASKPEPSGEI